LEELARWAQSLLSLSLYEMMVVILDDDNRPGIVFDRRLRKTVSGKPSAPVPVHTRRIVA
jgi:hypothetical protein